jgi:Ran GTPase-activating protein (RanGAP) involved in mRNA processing and transport
MSGNNFGLEGARYLAEQFKQLKAIKKLYLNGCNLTDKGVSDLATAFDVNGINLTELDLSGNAIG